MVVGCPIITTDIPENRELLKHLDSALLVQPGNPRQFAEAIIYLINNLDIRAKLGFRAKKEAQRFDVNKTVSQLDSFLHELL